MVPLGLQTGWISPAIEADSALERTAYGSCPGQLFLHGTPESVVNDRLGVPPTISVPKLPFYAVIPVRCLEGTPHEGRAQVNS